MSDNIGTRRSSFSGSTSTNVPKGPKRESSFRRLVKSFSEKKKAGKINDVPKEEEVNKLDDDVSLLRLARSSTLPGHAAIRKGTGPLVLQVVDIEEKSSTSDNSITNKQSSPILHSNFQTTKSNTIHLPPKVPRSRPYKTEITNKPVVRSSSVASSHVIADNHNNGVRKSIIKALSNPNVGQNSPTPSKRVTFLNTTETPLENCTENKTTATLKRNEPEKEASKTKTINVNHSNSQAPCTSRSREPKLNSGENSLNKDSLEKQSRTSSKSNIYFQNIYEDRNFSKSSVIESTSVSSPSIQSPSITSLNQPPMPPKTKLLRSSIENFYDKNINFLQNSDPKVLESTSEIGRSQQLIREEQEKRVEQLHRQHLKKIYESRSNQPKNRSLIKSDSLDNWKSTSNVNSTVKNVLRSNSYDNNIAKVTVSREVLKGEKITKSILKNKNQVNPLTNESSFTRFITRKKNKNHTSHQIEEPDNSKKELPSANKNIKTKKVEFIETENELKKNSSLSEKDQNIPKKPPRLSRKLSKSTKETFFENNDMKQNKLDKSTPSPEYPKKIREHPPLQKGSRNRQYQPPELQKDHHKLSEFSADPMIDQHLEDNQSRQPHSEATDKTKKQRKRSSTDNSSQETSSPNETDSNSGPLILLACIQAEEEQILKLLLGLIRKSPVLSADLLNAPDVSGRTILSHCCSNGFMRVVELLTSQPNIDINSQDLEKNTPLHHAAQGGHIDVVSHLVNTCSRKVNLDGRNVHGFTPLMKAALQGRTKIAKILLFAGASPHLRDYGRGLNAIEWAKYTGRNACGELIESVQRSCSTHIRDRWSSDAENKSSSTPNYLTSGHHYLHQPGDNKDSWLKHKIRKAFHKSDSKKEFSVASNLSTLATYVSSPLVPVQSQVQESVGVPEVQVTEINAPDCYDDPEDDTCSKSSTETTHRADTTSTIE